MLSNIDSLASETDKEQTYLTGLILTTQWSQKIPFQFGQRVVNDRSRDEDSPKGHECQGVSLPTSVSSGRISDEDAASITSPCTNQSIEPGERFTTAEYREGIDNQKLQQHSCLSAFFRIDLDFAPTNKQPQNQGKFIHRSVCAWKEFGCLSTSFTKLPFLKLRSAVIQHHDEPTNALHTTTTACQCPIGRLSIHTSAHGQTSLCGNQ